MEFVKSTPSNHNTLYFRLLHRKSSTSQILLFQVVLARKCYITIAKKNVNFFCKLHKYYNCLEVILILKSEYILNSVYKKLWSVAYVYDTFFFF